MAPANQASGTNSEIRKIKTGHYTKDHGKDPPAPSGYGGRVNAKALATFRQIAKLFNGTPNRKTRRLQHAFLQAFSEPQLRSLLYHGKSTLSFWCQGNGTTSSIPVGQPGSQSAPIAVDPEVITISSGDEESDDDLDQNSNEDAGEAGDEGVD